MMEELQDAIEDAQYVNAIATQDDGPKPVTAWPKPSPEELQAWRKSKLVLSVQKYDKNDTRSTTVPFSMEWFLQQEIGLFLFSAFLKQVAADYTRINFCEEVYRFQSQTEEGGGRKIVTRARNIVKKYLTPPERDPETDQIRQPSPTEIDECDLVRQTQTSLNNDKGNSNSSSGKNNNKALSATELENAMEHNYDYPICSESVVGVKSSYLEQAVQQLKVLEEAYGYRSLAAPEAPPPEETPEADEHNNNNNNNLTTTPMTTTTTTTTPASSFTKHMFDAVELIVLESLKQQYWEAFLESPQHKKLMDFLWYQDRPVVPDDFFPMRVLGRGGFGLVKACKKGTSGKLYAMKIMDKRRIKMKKSEQLTINERRALAAVDSKFVVNLKYAFHSKGDVYLILEMMTGGDLGYHLSDKGRFPKKRCLFYATRIMLALQALHDKGYVFRDLKPENCLLDEGGRVKITDLGLATKITPKLHGAAGTRGYWAPEMLRRDAKGKRMCYGHTVDWFSFGCCLAEFISGKNPFRSEAALRFGREHGKQTKEKAIDHATMEMNPEFSAPTFEPDAADLLRRLLDKNEKHRLGYKGCKEIMAHAYFGSVKWEDVIADREDPPFVPLKDVNAMSQQEIGNFAEDKAYQETVITEQDEKYYRDWNWSNPRAYATEVIEFLIYERETGVPLVPLAHHGSCCCVIL